MQALNIAALRFSEKLGICWSFFWRAILITLASMLAGGILGAIFGALVAASGAFGPSELQVAQVGGGVLGLVAGFFFLYLYVRWLLSAKLGKYRLLLVLAEEAADSAYASTVRTA